VAAGRGEETNRPITEYEPPNLPQPPVDQ
jgi:hypothetical protein